MEVQTDSRNDLSLTSPTGVTSSPTGAHTLARSTGSGEWAAHCFIVSPQRPTGEVFELEIDTLETTCHVLDPTPVANCTVRQLVEHVSAALRVTAGGAPRPVPWWFCKRQARLVCPASQPAFMASQRAVAKITVDATFPGAEFDNGSTFWLQPCPKPESARFQYHPVKLIS